MRILFFIAIVLVLPACALKPKYAMQTTTGLEVGVNQNTDKTFRLVDRKRRVIAKAKGEGKKLNFLLPAYTSPKVCYTVVDDKGKPLFKENTGFNITSVYEYNQKVKQKNRAKRQYARHVRNEKAYADSVRTSKATLQKNKLFNGRTCDVPPQRAVPPFPKTICGSYSQCKRLAQDSCIKNLVDAESCGAALSTTNVHSSITSVSCGALLSSLNGERYGIATGLQDALTGYLDQHTKNKIKEGEYGNAFFTAGIRALFTYYRTESCKENFARAAYAPIERWRSTKEYIEREPYVAQNRCAKLIRQYNASLKNVNDNKTNKAKLEKQIASLTAAIEKDKATHTAPKVCRL